MGKIYDRTPGVPVPFTLEKGKEYYRKSYKYTTLAISEMSKADLAHALKSVIRLTTRRKAEEFVKDAPDWTFRVLDPLGNCGDVCYRGVAIRHYYRRQISEHVIDVETPGKEKAIDPEDAWVYLDLTGLSAKEAHGPTLRAIADLEKKLAVANKRIASQEDVNISQEKEILGLERRIEQMGESLSRLRKKLEEVQHGKNGKNGKTGHTQKSRAPRTGKHGENTGQRGSSTVVRSGRGRG